MGIRVDRLSFGYGRSLVLDDLSLEVASGRLTVLLGKNGSGKSTLLKHIGGFLTAAPGQVAVDGRDLATLTGAARAKLIGFLPQGHTPVFPFRVEEVVVTGRAAGVRFLPGRQDAAAAQAALERVGIGHLAGRPYSDLSGGERQLVMIARVLVQAPAVLLLDEPLAHLDIANQVKMMRLFQTMAEEGLTVLVVLHEPNLALLYADDLALLKQGRILHRGPVAGLPDACLLEEAYDLALTRLPCAGRFVVVPRSPG